MYQEFGRSFSCHVCPEISKRATVTWLKLIHFAAPLDACVEISILKLDAILPGMTFNAEHLLLWSVVCIASESLLREFQWAILVSIQFLLPRVLRTS